MSYTSTTNVSGDVRLTATEFDAPSAQEAARRVMGQIVDAITRDRALTAMLGAETLLGGHWTSSGQATIQLHAGVGQQRVEPGSITFNLNLVLKLPQSLTAPCAAPQPEIV